MIKKEDTKANDTTKYTYNETRSEWRASFYFLGSEAWCKISKMEQHIYYYYFTALKWRPKKNSKVMECINNGGLEISFLILRKKIPMTSATYSKAIKNLVGVGLARLTRVGENKQCHKIELLGENLVPQNQQRWRNYPTKNWYHEAPYRPKNLVGKKTQWKKGQCGNPKFKSHPTKVNGIKDKRTTKVSYKNGNGLQNYID